MVKHISTSYFLKRKPQLQHLHISITNIRHNFWGNFQQIAPLSTNVAELQGRQENVTVLSLMYYYHIFHITDIGNIDLS